MLCHTNLSQTTTFGQFQQYPHGESFLGIGVAQHKPALCSTHCSPGNVILPNPSRTLELVSHLCILPLSQVTAAALLPGELWFLLWVDAGIKHGHAMQACAASHMASTHITSHIQPRGLAVLGRSKVRSVVPGLVLSRGQWYPG